MPHGESCEIGVSQPRGAEIVARRRRQRVSEFPQKISGQGFEIGNLLRSHFLFPASYRIESSGGIG